MLLRETPFRTALLAMLFGCFVGCTDGSGNADLGVLRDMYLPGQAQIEGYTVNCNCDDCLACDRSEIDAGQLICLTTRGISFHVSSCVASDAGAATGCAYNCATIPGVVGDCEVQVTPAMPSEDCPRGFP